MIGISFLARINNNDSFTEKHHSERVTKLDGHRTLRRRTNHQGSEKKYLLMEF